MSFTAFIMALLAGMIASRTSTLMSRGGHEETNAFRTVFDLLSMTATFGLVVLGFILFDWWLPIVAFGGISFLMAVRVSRRTLGALYIVSPIFGLVAIGGCAYGWYAWTVG